MRKLLAVAVACSTFGGLIGAMATAATQSQATQTALVRTAQRVEDTSADATLRTISSRLSAISTRLTTLSTISSRISALDGPLGNINAATSATNTSVSDGDNGIDLLLAQICDGQKVQDDEPLCSTPTGDSVLRHAGRSTNQKR